MDFQSIGKISQLPLVLSQLDRKLTKYLYSFFLALSAISSGYSKRINGNAKRASFFFHAPDAIFSLSTELPGHILLCDTEKKKRRETNMDTYHRGQYTH